MMDRLLDIIGVILDPRFWFRIDNVDHSWSDVLEEYMDRNYDINFSNNGCIVYIGPKRLGVWVTNWPCAYGHPFGGIAALFNDGQNLPRRKTAIRLKKYLNEYEDEWIKEYL